LLIPGDFNKAAAEIGRHSKSDADKYPAFCALAKNLSAFLQTLYGIALPDKANPRSFNPAELLKIGWKFHRLGEKEMYEFLRIVPMSVADWDRLYRRTHGNGGHGGATAALFQK